MINILNDLERKYLNFKLGEEQRNALLSVFLLLSESGFQECVISGRAGTGKTTISLLIIHFIENVLKCDYKLVTPTHKSKRILAEQTNREVTTIHQLLKLKPNIDILELDLKALKFCSNTLDDSVPENGIVLIDECSMINDSLYDTLVESCIKKNCKIIWQGDSKQLEPVNQIKIAKPFTCKNIIELTKIYRQKEKSIVLSVLEILRKSPIFQFKTLKSESGSIILFDSWMALIEAKIDLFKKALEDKEPNEIKFLAYTNKHVEAFNKIIRNKLFNSPNEYEPGDFLMGYDNCCYRSDKLWYSIDNSDDFRVISASKDTQLIAGIQMNGWFLELYDYDKEEHITVFVLSKDNDDSKLENLAKIIEETRIKAVLSKDQFDKKSAWKEYYNLCESFILPFDLYYEDKLIKKKSIDYGYAITVHKSQSSSYDNILVDMKDIYRCSNSKELRQLQYVALSRTRHDIYMLT